MTNVPTASLTPGQVGNFAVLLDVLHEVALSDGERASPTWLAGFEAHTCGVTSWGLPGAGAY